MTVVWDLGESHEVPLAVSRLDFKLYNSVITIKCHLISWNVVITSGYVRLRAIIRGVAPSCDVPPCTHCYLRFCPEEVAVFPEYNSRWMVVTAPKHFSS